MTLEDFKKILSLEARCRIESSLGTGEIIKFDINELEFFSTFQILYKRGEYLVLTGIYNPTCKILDITCDMSLWRLDRLIQWADK